MSDDPFEDFEEPFAEDRQNRGDATTAPKVETPEVEPPSNPVTRAEELEAQSGDVDPELKALFWKLVFLYKIGLIGLTIGALLTASGMYPTRGQILLVGSVTLLLYAVIQTRRGKQRIDAGEFDLDTDEPAESAEQRLEPDGSTEPTREAEGSDS